MFVDDAAGQTDPILRRTKEHGARRETALQKRRRCFLHTLMIGQKPKHGFRPVEGEEVNDGHLGMQLNAAVAFHASSAAMRPEDSSYPTRMVKSAVTKRTYNEDASNRSDAHTRQKRPQPHQ